MVSNADEISPALWVIFAGLIRLLLSMIYCLEMLLLTMDKNKIIDQKLTFKAINHLHPEPEVRAVWYFVPQLKLWFVLQRHQGKQQQLE